MKFNNNAIKNVCFVEATYSTSFDCTPIVIDTGATFGTIPFVDVLIP